MPKRIVLLQGHPDAGQRHLCHALGNTYCEAAGTAGHEARQVDVGRLDFPLLRSQQEWEQGALPPGLLEAQAAVEWADHLVLIFPLWLGDMPALLKGFPEQIMRPGFAFSEEGGNPLALKRLKGRSARVICTMGMPAAVYRWYFRAHSLKSLERNILGFVGIAPVDETLIGMVGKLDDKSAAKLLARMATLGREGK